MKLIFLSHLCLVLMVSSTALASSWTLFNPDQAKIEKMRVDARKLIESAIANGVTKVNGYTLAPMLKQVDKPLLFMMRHFRIVYDQREGGAYQLEPAVKDGTFVGINPTTYDKTPSELRAPWMLHELLGALGYPDHEFSMSLQIYWAARMPLQASLMARLIHEHNPLILADGGSGTSAGGGGDPLIIQIKLDVLQFLGRLMTENPAYQSVDIDRLATIVLDCGFEFYHGKYAVFAREYEQGFHNMASHQDINVPWAIVHIRRDWYQAPLDKGDRPQIDIIMDGIVGIGKSITPVLCRDPGMGYRLEGNPP